MNMFKLIKDVYYASESGKQLAKPSTWANRASVTATLVVFFNALVGIVGPTIGIDPSLISPEDLQQVAAGVSVVGVIVADRLHVASNADAGKVK